MFFINTTLLGVGLAMDSFSVSLVNGLREPKIAQLRECKIASVYAFFQFAMPMAGWICVHTIVVLFSAFQVVIPWIAFALLGHIGGKMIYDSLFAKGEGKANGVSEVIGARTLLMQGVATSIDALSVGFAIAEYTLIAALFASFIIAAVTFIISLAGVKIGKRAGTYLASGAEIAGGVILICIGLEILIRALMNK